MNNVNIEDTEVSKVDKILIQKELAEAFHSYHSTLKYMLGDAPISSLCLNKSTENILLNNGFLRIYDLFDRDLTEVKGLGDTRIRNLTSSLDEFLAMF